MGPLLRPAGVQEVAIDTVLSEICILVSSAGNFNGITFVHMKKFKNNAFAGNPDILDNEFDLTGSRAVYSSKSSSANSLVEPSMHGKGL